MNNDKIKKLADNILSYSVNLQKNENILIEIMGIEALPLAKELMQLSYLKGAFPYFNIIDIELLEEIIKNSSENQMLTYGNYDLQKMKDMDAYIGINPNSKELSIIDSKQLEIYNKFYTAPVHLEQRVKHTKWCILRYPSENLAQKNNMFIEEYTNYFFNVCNVDYNKMSVAMDKLIDVMNKTDKVHILGNNTDLTFSIKNIPAQKYVGTFNLPDGEVATAPIKNSVNGHIAYNTKTKFAGNIFENIFFEFQDGKIVNATSLNNTEKLNDILNTDDGARYIGEFALGLNPYIKNACCDTLFDEKIAGSFHFTPGQCIEESPNGNTSAIHWDLVCIQTPEYGGGEIWFDNVLIRKDGKFVVSELKCLNPENLI